MGCATSKPKVCKNCKGGASSPVRRSYSLHAYIPAEMDEHMVALTSSTLGSMRLDLLDHQKYLEEKCQDLVLLKKEEFAMGVVEARTWSKMIDERIPKIVPRTPITTPPGEPETIDAWELMAGLEDTSPLNLKRPPAFNHIRSFSFHLGSGNFAGDDNPTPKVNQVDPESDKSRKPLWLTMAEDESPVSIEPEFDPEVISSFRKSLEELPPASPFHLKPLAGEEKDAPPSETSPPEKDVPAPETLLPPLPPRVKERLIVYFTSLRGVRKTYEDCCSVRVILKGLGVKVDERDVSMHSGFKDELKELLGEGWFISKGGLPKVFIGNKFLGSVEEIKRLNEEGRLEKAVDGCETVEDGGGAVAGASCEACGDVRFVPCETCSGSCKIYCEGEYRNEDDDDDDEEDLEGEFGFQRCPDCNENGLTRCPLCCDY